MDFVRINAVFILRGLQFTTNFDVTLEEADNHAQDKMLDCILHDLRKADPSAYLLRYSVNYSRIAKTILATRSSGVKHGE